MNVAGGRAWMLLGDWDLGVRNPVGDEGGMCVLNMASVARSAWFKLRP